MKNSIMSNIAADIKSDTELTVDELKKLVDEYKKTVKEIVGETISRRPLGTNVGGIGAVFSSWNGKRAVGIPSYRKDTR